MKNYNIDIRLHHRAVFNDWGLYTFMQMLAYKCVLYGKELVTLDERDTSKICSGCGHKQNMPLWKRMYRCPNTECHLVVDRDENSAVNILKRYFARRGPHSSTETCGVLQDDPKSVEVAEASSPLVVQQLNMFKHV